MPLILPVKGIHPQFGKDCFRSVKAAPSEAKTTGLFAAKYRRISGIQRVACPNPQCNAAIKTGAFITIL